MTRKARYKNIALLSTYIISQIPSYFVDSDSSFWLSIMRVRENPTHISFLLFYYGIAVNFFILAYCLHFKRNVSKKVTTLILIISVLDFIHLLFLAKQGFGTVKIALAFFIYFLIKRFYKND